MTSELVDYSFLKTLITAKNITWQYVEYDTEYSVFTTDGGFVYKTTLYKSGSEPIGCTDCAADTLDFETNYKSDANAPIQTSVKYLTIPNIGVTKAEFPNRAWLFCHNFCDKTTWCPDSVRVVSEAVGTGDGVTVTFSLANTNIVDTTHGKLSDEDYLVPTAAQTGSDYKLHVFVNGVEKTEQEFGNSGGDWTANYATGQVTFLVAPANTTAITASYFYATTSTMYLRPSPGKITTITSAEAQFSENLGLTNNLISAYFTYNPGLGAPPAKFEYPGSRTTFKRMWDFVNWTNGSFPPIPAMGGVTRGFSSNVYQLRFDYVTPLVLNDAYGTEMRLWINHHTPFTGELAQITFYGYTN